MKVAYKAKFCWSFRVFDCSEQFFKILFCTDCLIIVFEGYKYNNQLLRARMIKHLCNDFAVIFQCPTTVNKQEGLWIWRLLPEELFFLLRNENKPQFPPVQKMKTCFKFACPINLHMLGNTIHLLSSYKNNSICEPIFSAWKTFLKY